MSINKVMITGNLTRDPELRSTPSGTSVLGLGVAVNDRRRNPQTNEWEDRPNYIDCTIFGARADALNKYLSKGMKVAIEGRLQWHQWEKDGQKRSKIDVIVDELEFMSSRDGGGSSYQQPSAAPAPASNYADVPPAPTADGYSDEDIPF